MPYPGLLYPEPLPLQQATADPCLLRRHSNTLSQVWFSLLGSPGAHKVLLEPSECLWWLWGLIVNLISPLLLSCRVFPFTLGCGVCFFSGFQHPAVDGCSRTSCDFGALSGGHDHTSCYSAIMNQSPKSLS